MPETEPTVDAEVKPSTPLEALLVAQRDGDREAEGRLIPQLVGRPKPLPTSDPMWLWTKIAFGHQDCWYWTASRTPLGYGSCARVLGECKAHRYAYRQFNGPIPPGMHVLHTCDVRNCVNPDHLFLGTHRDNMRDMASKGRGGKGDSSGERNGQARLTWKQVELIREHVAAGGKQIEMARRLGVSPMTVSRAARGESWR